MFALRVGLPEMATEIWHHPPEGCREPVLGCRRFPEGDGQNPWLPSGPKFHGPHRLQRLGSNPSPRISPCVASPRPLEQACDTNCGGISRLGEPWRRHGGRLKLGGWEGVLCAPLPPLRRTVCFGPGTGRIYPPPSRILDPLLSAMLAGASALAPLPFRGCRGDTDFRCYRVR